MSFSVLPSVEQNARSTVTSLFAFIKAQAVGDYIGESVSQLQHSLQAATFAQQASADDDIVLGALLHDVGRFIPTASNMPAMIAPDGTYVGNESHEILGENYLRQLGFSDTICQVVGAHVMAKRYLTATDNGYYDALSKSSKATLKFQGGSFDDAQVKAAQQDPLLEAKLSVRRWDDQAKDPNMQTPNLASFADMAVASLLRSRSTVELDGSVYRLPAKPTVLIHANCFTSQLFENAVADSTLPHLLSMLGPPFSAKPSSDLTSSASSGTVSSARILQLFQRRGARVTQCDGEYSSTMDDALAFLRNDRADLVSITLTDDFQRYPSADPNVLLALDSKIGELIALDARVIVAESFADRCHVEIIDTTGRSPNQGPRWASMTQDRAILTRT